MSTPAPALPTNRVSRRQRRRQLWARVPLQWHAVPVAQSAAFVGRASKPPRRGLFALAAFLVIAAHVLGVWIGHRYTLTAQPKPKPKELAIELVRPPKPLPKIEPPPPPPKKERKAPPPIQTAAPVPSTEPVAAPVESVAAIVPAEPAPPAPPAPEPVKPAFGGIGYKNNPAPDYPAQAVRQGWQGTVLLRVKVLQTGAVDSIEVVKSSGKKLLDDAAVHTVERWVFAPSTRGTTPVDGFATVPIEFKLDS
jgi:periplasmic protein TonB